MLPYRHTQIAYVVLVSIGAALILAAIVMPGDTPLAARAALLGLVALIGLTFSALTVEVRDRTLRIWFGPGFLRRQWPLDEIETVRTVSNPWYVGWGIHWAGCWVYNVSGSNAIEVALHSGRRFRIGTNEPEALLNALRRAGVSEP